MSTPSTTCPPPPLDVVITDLEDALKKQDTADAKGHLAAVRKISDEVAQAEAKYAKDFQALQIDYEQSKNYGATRRPKLEAEVTKPEQDRIKEIVACYDAQEVTLKEKWDKARGELPKLQNEYADAQNSFADQETPYKEALKFRSKQDDLDALETEIEKNVETQKLRAAYFLINEMKPTAPALPEDFSEALRATAGKFEGVDHNQRKAKTALDLGIAETQKAKKAYDDSKAKRRENILKQIAEEPFTPPPPKKENGSSTGEGYGSVEAAAREQQQG